MTDRRLTDALKHADRCDPESAAYIRGLVELVRQQGSRIYSLKRDLRTRIGHLEQVEDVYGVPERDRKT